jgi:hypothetical protein
MKIVDLTDLKRREAPVLYRKVYDAVAVMELMAETLSAAIEFVVEHKPLGGVDIRVTMTDDVDYPIIPIISALKNHIQDMYDKGSLP